MQETEHYKLKKPAVTDFYNIADQNENADKLEAALDGLETGKEALVKNASEKSAPADADSLAIIDSADSSKTKRLTWSNLKAVLKTWLDSLYATVSHNHAWSAITGKPTAFTPTSHAATHKTGGADALTPADVGAAAASHTHGSLTNDGKIGATADLPIFTGTGGALATKTAAAARTALGVPSVADTTALLTLPPWVRIATYETAGAFTWTAPDLFNGANYDIGGWMCGGGGAGGVALRNSGTTTYYYQAVGGASGRARAFKMTVTPGQVYNLVVGVGGAAAVAATSLYANGNSGGSTSFNGISVDGGEGGKYAYDSSSDFSYKSLPAAIGAQCSVGLTQPLSTSSLYLFNTFLMTMNPFGGVLVPHSLRVRDGSPIYDFWNLGMVGFPNECFDPFACEQRLGAGASALYTVSSSPSGILFPPGLNPTSGLGGGAGSITNGTPAGDATAPGCGGGALCYAASGPIASRNGAGAPGAVYIYARRVAA
ncbi:hypothetical protein KL86CLO1_10515 [uncultured Eubacteriales bacterium]|uniref:Phage tail collar domain-containing protein n=1 Tax=uncultured Eubacteriales bacterium TaxID=172733 RepID=A0A212J4R8_9FIRM|nr:hypothetical protein KL86CLO1_10515 [uncultured Eubacteriales bacterium]